MGNPELGLQTTLKESCRTVSITKFVTFVRLTLLTILKDGDSIYASLAISEDDSI